MKTNEVMSVKKEVFWRIEIKKENRNQGDGKTNANFGIEKLKA